MLPRLLILAILAFWCVSASTDAFVAPTGGPVFTQAISRSFTVGAPPHDPVLSQAISRAFTVSAPPHQPAFSQAISRAFTVRYLEPHITLGAPSVFESAGPGTRVAAGNLDTSSGDLLGTNDVVIIVPGPDPELPGEIQVFLNQGTTAGEIWLGLEAQPPIMVGADPSGIAVADFNLDNFLDIAVTNATDDTVSILLNTGSGDATFTAAPEITGLSEPRAIATADFTANGRSDLLVSNLGDDTIAVFENVAPGSFVLVQQLAVPAGILAVDPSDLDNDKDAEAALAGFGTDTISVLENIGAGGPFNPPFDLGVGMGPVDVAAGDLDGNAFADLVSADNLDDTLSVVVNNGALAFEAAFAVPVGMAPAAVVIDDFDGDTDMDLALVAVDATIGQAVQVVENYVADGLGFVLAPPVAFSAGAGEAPNSLVAVELNGDGLDDVVTVNTGDEPSGGSVTALLLTCSGDINGNGVVEILDFLELLSGWGPCPQPCPPMCVDDLTGDCTVDIDDFLEQLGHWGPCGG